jgi:hypothetical protein
MTRSRFVFGGALAFVLALDGRALAFCPSYTPSGTAGGQNCGVLPTPGKNPDVATWQTIFAKVAGGKATWGSDGPDIGVMGAGCANPIATHDVPAHFPCHVLQAIAMQESGWQQFCVPDSPASSVGAPERTIVSFDCGYGVGQVTTGMHVGETPTFDRDRVAGDPTYNLATGTLILRDKWKATKCVGDNNPDLVEDWYTAIWAYYGLAYSNNPNNPNLKADRGPYDPAKGGSYTYQERVLGWMEHPTSGRWPVLAPAYPNRGDIGGAGSPPALPEPSCASPTDCTTTRPTHASSCGAPAQPVDAGSPVDAALAPPRRGDASTSPPPLDDAPATEEGGCSCRAAAPARGQAPSLVGVLVGVWLGVRRARAGRARARRSARR